MAFKLAGMADVLRRAGIKVVEVEGWKTRGYLGQDLAAVLGVMWHHTATNRAAFVNSNAPTLNLCINGRSDLAGPLCNIVLGRDGTAYIVAAGVANHAGTGFIGGIPANAGNHYTVGIEMESSGIAPWDWTPAQLAAAPRIGAALESAYGASIQPGHNEYSDAGKIDPAGWPGGMNGLRASINNIISGAPAKPQGGNITPLPSQKGGFLMALTDAEQKELLTLARQSTPTLIWRTLIGRNGKYNTALQELADCKTELLTVRAVVSQLAEKQGVAIDYGRITSDVKAALADGIKVEGTITVGGTE